MKIYLHGPRAGQTILINGIQFINGVAEAPSLPVYHERYYNVKDYPPDYHKGGELKNVSITINSLDAESMTEIIAARKGMIVNMVREATKANSTTNVAKEATPSDETVDNDNAEADLRNLVEARKAIIEAKAEAAAREEALAKAEPKASPFAMNPNKKSSKPIDAKYERNPSMSYIEQMNTYGTWGEMRKFVMLSVGRDINDKKEAIKALEYLDKQ